ncbi:MAG: DNA-3-methyladenine glycosylase [Acidimicrobiaceae bacterium]|nr:DNA-3-methyladenine glycosylase [Acidimicrobiaceae bacterium]
MVSSYPPPARQRLPGPLDLPATLEGYRRWGDDLIDRWDGTTWARSHPCPWAATVTGPDTVEVVAHGTVDVASMIVQEPLDHVLAEDAVIRAVAGAHPGVRPVLQPDPLTGIIKSISAQQVNLRWACTTRRRLVTTFGRAHSVGATEVWSYDVDRLAAADPSQVRALQFTTKKSEFIVAAARLAASGGLERASFDPMADDEVVVRLVALHGVGRWTAEWFIARTLGRPVVVAGDLGIRKAVGIAYFDGRMPSEAEVRAATTHWGPAAGVCQQLLLHALSEGTLPVLVRSVTA